jgi:hypothetical protein
MWPQLHAAAEVDVVFVTEATLLRFTTDALKRLAQNFGVFVVRHTTRVLVQGTLYYDAPPRHLSTLHVAILENGKPLVASSTKEQELRSTTYATTQASAAKPVRWWIQDKAGVNRIGIVPVPGVDDAGDHLDIVFHSYPCEIEEGIETIKTWGDYLEACVLRDAYLPESDFQIPESAQSYDGLSKLYESVAMSLWAKAQ